MNEIERVALLDAKPTPAETELLQNLLDRYSENGGIIPLPDDWPAFLKIISKHTTAAIAAMRGEPDSATDAENQRLRAEVEALREALVRIATVDMGGGFLGAQACRQVANQALTRKVPQ